MKKILIPLPNYGFDPSETAIPWKILIENNIEVVFATPNGNKASADSIMLTGTNLGLWKSVLMARKDAIQAYYEMEKSQSFSNPISYNSINETYYSGIILPGGHDKSVKEYLESKVLQDRIVEFFNSKKPVGAVCHGVVLVARSIDPITNKSVINKYKTTSLLKTQELLAYKLTKRKLGDYYLTYPTTVEDEIKSVLVDKSNFIIGKPPILRDSKNSLKKGFCVKDKNYLSARWPGDIYNFSFTFTNMVSK